MTSRAARPTDRLHAREVAGAVAAEHGILVDLILGPGRSVPVVAARWELYRRLAEARWSQSRIARALGVDRTSVGHALHRLGDARLEEASPPFVSWTVCPVCGVCVRTVGRFIAAHGPVGEGRCAGSAQETRDSVLEEATA